MEIGVEASFLFLSHLAVCVMFICGSAVSALLHDSQETPEQIFEERAPPRRLHREDESGAASRGLHSSWTDDETNQEFF